MYQLEQFNNYVQFPPNSKTNFHLFSNPSKNMSQLRNKLETVKLHQVNEKHSVTIVKDNTLDPTSFKNNFIKNILDAQILLG